jgi:hypothetical protein
MKKSRFAQYAADESNRMFVGTLVKFAKGIWQMGPDKPLISPNQRFVALMGSASTGFLKWGGGTPIDSRMGLIADGFRAPPRDELDDLDSENWETDEDGDRLDPWQKTTLLVLISPTAPHDVFTFSTTTVGGGKAVADLCGAHARTTEDAGQYPVVTLAGDSYQHKIKSRGRIDYPIFKIVDCVEAGPFNAIVAEARGGAVFIPTSPPALGTPDIGPIAITSGRQPPTPPTPPAEDIEHEDEIPPPITEVPEGSGEFDIPF